MPCLSSFCCCLNRSPQTESKTKNTKVRCLKRVYNCFLSTVKVLCSSILLATVLWLFIRLPEPSVYLTGMQIEAIDSNLNKPESTLLHYNLTLRNGDLYKHLDYDVLLLILEFSDSKIIFIVNFNKIMKSPLHQKPGNSTLLPNHPLNYSRGWLNSDLINLKNHTSTIVTKFIMEVRCRVFNRYFRRQVMRVAEVYFRDDGKAFINPRRGLKLS